MKKINVGMIGGGLMCKLHSAAYSLEPIHFCRDREFLVVRKVISDVNEQLARGAADKYLWEEYCTDWRQMTARKDIDMIDIATPTYLHKEMALEAAKNGKMIYCEKPMALTKEECLQMCKAAAQYGVRTAVGFNKRRWPAVQFAKKLIDSGDIGDVIYFRGRFLAGQMLDPAIPMCWRFEKDKAGVGCLTEAGAHLIDAARFLLGEFKEVTGIVSTTFGKRPLPQNGKDFYTKTDITAETPMGEVETDDMTVFLARTKNGAVVTMENTGVNSGEGNDMGFEVWGTKGAIKWQEQYANELQLSEEAALGDRRGFKVIEMGGEHPYADRLWGSTYFGLGLVDNKCLEIHDFIDSFVNDKPYAPSFTDGFKAAQIIDAVVESSVSKCWVEIEDINL